MPLPLPLMMIVITAQAADNDKEPRRVEDPALLGHDGYSGGIILHEERAIPNQVELRRLKWPESSSSR